MEKRYFRQYEKFDSVVPRVEDFPILKGGSTSVAGINSGKLNLKSDDLILLGILVLMLLEEEKDITAILIIAFLFLSEYIT